VAQDLAVSTQEDQPVGITMQGSNVDGDTLIYAIGTGPSHGTLSGTAPNLTYTPNPDYNGADSFTYTVSDGSASDTATVQVTVTAVNDPPVAQDLAVSTQEDQPVGITLQGSDVDGDTLIYAIGTGPSHGTLSGTAPNLTYTPDADYSGADSFTYTVSDGSVTSAPATVSITVSAVNDPPVANDDSAVVEEDSSVTIPVLANDKDVEGEALTITGVSAAAHGTAVVTADNQQIVYTPNPDFNGADSFTYTVSDGSASDTATVQVTVTAVNDPPVANDDSAETEQEVPVVIQVLANDSDVDGDQLTITAVSDPSNGTAEIASGEIIYTPDSGFAGTDTFDYTVSDGKGGTDTATVLVTVNQTAAPEFRTQLVKLTIPAGESTVAAKAPEAFQSVDPAHTIVLIAGITGHAMGWTQQVRQNPDDISALVDLPDGSTLTAERVSSIDKPDTVWVLLIEYIGAPGGPNEFIVRDRRTYQWKSKVTKVSYGPVASVGDPTKVVVFNTGVANANTKTNQYDRGDVRSYLGGDKVVYLERADGNGVIASGHQVVEFVGTNWTIQSGDTVPSPHDPSGGPEAGGTDVSISPVSGIDRCWIYFTFQTSSPSLQERGHRVWLTAANNLRVQEHSNATATKIIRWYVIENPNIRVQTSAADSLYKNELTATIGGFQPVEDTGRAFAWAQGLTNGGGNAHPRDMWQFELKDSSTIFMQRGYSGQQLSYRCFVVELP